ncbi:MAG TPA: manganese efflux pump MntP family protein [Phycisphaerae bacterium]|nr:manganese efflux pump MntP family protein [Phycisphaerae bacterium]
MSILTIVVVALGLSMDALAVAIAAAITLDKMSGRHVFRLAFHFGLFQALMPIMGWLAGRQLQQFIASWDHWIAFALLAFIGAKAIREALVDSNGGRPRDDPTRGLTLVGLAVATSIDALAVGVSLAMLRISIWYPSVVIGCITCAITAIGMVLGTRLGKKFGKRVEVIGGLVLIGIGLKILIQH